MIALSIFPLVETKHKELRVVGSAEQALITPSSGKKIRVYGVQMSQMVTQALNATLRASLSFGMDGVTDLSKVLMSYRQNKADDTASIILSGINVVGDIDEPITLTNMTFSSGAAITRAIVYYNEK